MATNTTVPRIVQRDVGEPSPTGPALRPAPAEEGAAAPVARPKRKKAPLVFGGLAVTAALVAGIFWVRGHGKESTDDAFVEAHVATVAARTPGQVLEVRVHDNQTVNVGDILVVLDDRDQKVRLDTARADLMSAEANLAATETQLALTEKNVSATLKQAQGGIAQATALAGSSKAGIDQARADVDAALSRQKLAQVELDRAKKLRDDGAISQADLDARQATFDQAVASVAQARAREQSAASGITNANGTIETARGRLEAAQAGPEQVATARAAVAVAKAKVAQAKAAVDQAELNLGYTKVTAQVRGVVSRRSVEVGQTVDPARPLMALTALDDVWVVANFKEDQIAEMRPGQKVRVKVDAFSSRPFTGHVDSLAGGSGARFSLLPPDNASGNFTKVVQRIPVLIRFDDKPADMQLRPGMSTYVTVTTAGGAGAQSPSQD